MSIYVSDALFSGAVLRECIHGLQIIPPENLIGWGSKEKYVQVGWSVKVNVNGVKYCQYFENQEGAQAVYDRLFLKMKGETNMFKEIKSAASDFLKENRSLITWVAVLFLADHFFFGGKFRERLHTLVDKIIGKIEKKAEDM